MVAGHHGGCGGGGGGLTAVVMSEGVKHPQCSVPPPDSDASPRPLAAQLWHLTHGCVGGGAGVARDATRGAALLEAAAEAGDVDAMQAVARCYKDGARGRRQAACSVCARARAATGWMVV